MPSRQCNFPQNPPALDDFLHKDDMEGGNLKICPRHLLCPPFYAFYNHHPCLAQMRRLDARSSASPGTLGHWWTCFHAHEGHGYVSCRFFFVYFTTPFVVFPWCDWLNTIRQCAIIPDRSIIASNIPKREEEGPHTTLLFSRSLPADLLMVSKESHV